MKKILLITLLFVSSVFAQQFTIHFDSNSHKVNENEIYKVNKLIDFLLDNPDLAVVLEGHTDSIDTYKYNQKLSEKRVHTVKEHLINEGILEFRIKTMAYGEKKPKVSNMLKEGRKENRRVTANITPQDNQIQ